MHARPRVSSTSIALFGAIASSLVFPHLLAGQTEQATLYERVGGYDVIAAVVDDFFGRMAGDPALQPLLAGVTADQAGRVRQHFVDFFCARAGGPCVYHGRDMASAHDGLGIGDAHFDATVGYIIAALEAHGVGATERQEIRGLLSGLRGEVIGG